MVSTNDIVSINDINLLYIIKHHGSKYGGISWTMLGRVSEILKCWKSDTNPFNQKERWKTVPACIW